MNITPDMWPADTEALRTRITRLEAQSEARRLQVAYWKERADEFARAVREVHYGIYWVDVDGEICEECDHPYPCRTIRALEVSPD